MGDLFQERKTRSSIGEMLSVTIGHGVIKSESLDRKDNSSHDKSNYKQVCVGDIAYNSMRMWQGASGVSDYNGIVSPAYTVITPGKSSNSDFFSYEFKLTSSLQTFQKFSQGLTSDTWNLKFPLLKEIPVNVPSLSEQISIVEVFNKLDKTIVSNQLQQKSHESNSIRDQ